MIDHAKNKLVQASIKKCELLFKEGDYKGAVKAALNAVSLDNSSAVAHNNAGVSYYHLGEMKQAIYHYLIALNLYKDQHIYNKEIIINLCNAYIVSGMLVEAENVLKYVSSMYSETEYTDLLSTVNHLRTQKIISATHDLLEIIKKQSDVVIGVFHSYRIGHLVANTENFLRLLQLGLIPKDKTYIFFATEYPANRQMLDMYKRHMNIIENKVVFDFLATEGYKFLDGWDHWINLYSMLKGNEYNLFNTTQTTVNFTDDEEKRGQQELERMGITKKDWFVLIFARDSEYLKVHSPNADWSYHDHRDLDINKFHKAIKFIIDKGGYVIRMGEIVGTELKYKHKRCIHYAGSDLRSDFMDVYLSSKCSFFIGSAAGIMVIASVAFEKPVCTIGMVPIGIKDISKSALCYIPQKLKRICDGSYVRYPQIFNEHSLFMSTDGNLITQNGYVYEQNTEEEIFETTVEMYNKVNGIALSQDDAKLLEKYFALYPVDHPQYENKNPIAVSYLKRNYKLFFGDG